MKLRTIASPLTIASFITVAITGLCMVLGYRNGLVSPIHEFSSLAFVFGCVLHVLANKQAVLAHLKRPLGAILTGLFLIVTVAAFVPLGNGSAGGSPVKKSVALLMDADLTVVAELTKNNEQVLQERLKQHGFTVTAPGATVRQIATASHKNPMEVLSILISDTPVPA